MTINSKPDRRGEPLDRESFEQLDQSNGSCAGF